MLFKAVGGGIIIHFRSTEQLGAVVHHYPNFQLSSAWNTAQFLHITKLSNNYLFLIANTGKTLPPPQQAQQLGPSDSAIITNFSSNFPAIDLEVQQSAGQTRLTPPPMELDPDARFFFRVDSDPTLDTDADGTPDWLEFADTSSPSGGLSSNPFVGDTNGNGLPDGQEQDADSDGAPNSYDAAMQDPMVKWQPNSNFLFAFFSVVGSGDPLQVNDRGQVLFERSLWSAGQQISLATDTSLLKDCYPLGFNDSGKIIGIGHIDFPGDNFPNGDSCLITWPTTGGDPSPLRAGDKYLIPISIPSKDPRRADFAAPSDMTINNAGQFIAFSAEAKRNLDSTEGPNTVYSLVLDNEPAKVWQSSGGATTQMENAPQFMAWKTDTGAFVGRDQTGKFKIGSQVFTQPYTNTAVLPGGQLAALLSEDILPIPARVAPSWEPSTALGDAIDVSEEGRFVLRKGWEIWHNGDGLIRLGHERAPGLSGWDDDMNCSFIDTTKHGWTLATKGKSSPQSIVGLPISLTTAQVGGGVDTESALASDSPSYSPQLREGNKDEFWIMVPSGKTTQITVRSAATSVTPVSIAPGAGITSSPTVLASPETVVSFSAPQSAAELESDIQFKISGLDAISKPVRAKVMKSRTVNVSVWPMKRPGVPAESPPSNPPPLPSEQEFEDALNEIFEPQINCRFNITIQEQANLPSGTMSTLPIENPPSEPIRAIADSKIAESEDGAQIHVFVLGGVISLASGSFTYDGFTNPSEGWVWLSTPKLAAGSQVEKEAWFRTLSHEIGHVLLRGGHPDNNAFPGRAGLPGLPSLNRYRLMHSGWGVSSTGRRLLVKSEWDEAQSWLIKNVDLPNP